MYLSILKLSENDNNMGENNSSAICNCVVSCFYTLLGPRIAK